ncbi:MAG: FAD-dependent oxidoreductase, partial [Sneathiella sp.]|nr:FAD-dependent oxidoreductase [Sneathiella sp.]
MTNARQDCCETNSALKPNGSYDIAVIGAGSAGFSAAITAAEQGAQVALIGHGTVGGILVRGAAALAHKWGVPSLIVGLTIVAFGTSAPELIVS